MAEKVPAPQRKPRVGGIKSLLEFVPEQRLTVAMAAGGLAWEDALCGFPSLTRAGCYDLVTPDADKAGDGPAQFTTIRAPFVQYFGVECWMGGDNDESGPYIDQARAGLQAGEHKAIETFLYNWAVGGTGVNQPTLVDAIAMADSLADGEYPYRPVLIMGRHDLDRGVAAGVLLRSSSTGEVVTGNGTPVIGVADASAGVIGIIGQPVVYASDVNAGVANDPTQNQTLAIAERAYAIGVDCDFRYGITVVPPAP